MCLRHVSIKYTASKNSALLVTLDNYRNNTHSFLIEGNFLDTCTEAEINAWIDHVSHAIQFKGLSNMRLDKPGDSLKGARKITLSSKLGTVKDRVGNADPNDYFKFRLRRSSSATLALTGLKADANLELLNRRGKVVASSSLEGKQKESIKLDSLDKGKYFVRVSQNQGNTRYRLKFTGNPQKPTEDVPSKKNHPFVQKVLALTNVHRKTAGLTPLTLNSKLNNVAHAHSKSMAVDDFFSHTGADGSTAFDRISAEGYQYRKAAENIGAGYSTPESVVNAWMNSPGHRENILNGDLKEIGIGYYYLKNDTGAVKYNNYWTQAFGTPFR